MKKLFTLFLVIASLFATPALAAAKKTVAPTKPTWKAVAPTDYAPITWASAPGMPTS